MDLNSSINSKTVNSQNKVKTCMCNSCCRFLGNQVYVKNNIKGTLRFLGRTHFANGIWCGLELNDQIGESNGCINNVEYFSCEDNYGIFVPASETYIIYNSDTSNLSIMEIISSAKSESCHIHLEFQNPSLQDTYKDHDVLSEIPVKNNLNESYTISNHPTKLSVIIEESTVLDFSANISHVSKLDNISSNCIVSNILKDHIVEDSFSAISQEVHKLLDQNFKESNKSILSDSTESLGIIPELLDLNNCDDVNFDTCLQKNNLNSTFNLCHDFAEKLNGEQDVFMPYLDSNNVLSSSNLPTASHFFSSTESPVQTDKSTIYASTPKQESQENISFDDLPSDFHPNKCVDIKPVIGAKANETEIKKITLANLKECDIQPSISPIRNGNLISENNILNETFEILDNTSISSPHNEMHHNLKDLNTKNVKNEKVIIEEEDKLKFAQTLENYDDKQNILNVTCDLSRKNDSKEILTSPIDKNDILNITCEIEPLAKDPLSFNDFEVLKSTESVFNVTLSYPPESKNDNENATKELMYKFSGDNNARFQSKTSKMIDTMYEKIDLSPKVNLSRKSMQYKQPKMGVGKICKNNKENVPTTSILPKENAKIGYPTCDQNKNLRKNGCFDSANTDKRENSKKQRNLYGSFSSITESNVFEAKSTEFKSEDLHLQSKNVKKISARNFRKSVGSFGSIDIIKKENYDKEPRRNSFGSSNTMPGSKSVKANVTSVPLNLNSHSSNTSVKNMPKSYNQISCTKGLNEKALSHLPLASKRNIKAENKVVPKQDKKKSPRLLSEDTNLASISSDLGKTVVKKPRKSMFISDPFKIPFEQCDTANNQSNTFKAASIPVTRNKSSLKMAVCLNKNLEELHDESISVHKATFKGVSSKSPLTFNKNENKQIRFSTNKSNKHFPSGNVKTTCNSSSERNIAFDQPSSSKHVSNLSSYNGQRASGCISIQKKPVSEECKANQHVNLNETMVLNTETNNQKNGKVLNKEQPKKEPFSRIPSVRSKTRSGVLVAQLQNENKKNSKEQSNQGIITRKSTTHKIRSARTFPK